MTTRLNQLTRENVSGSNKDIKKKKVYTCFSDFVRTAKVHSHNTHVRYAVDRISSGAFFGRGLLYVTSNESNHGQNFEHMAVVKGENLVSCKRNLVSCLLFIKHYSHGCGR